jgi:hypothetical protein
MRHAKRELEQNITSKKHLLKVHFILVLFLALSIVIDLHIKLQCIAVVVKENEKPLVEVISANWDQPPLKYISPHPSYHTSIS